jgi:hypothetical protein
VQDADFLGIVQIFVYTAAVMMLFYFVLTLVDVHSSDSLAETSLVPDKGPHRWLPAVISGPLRHTSTRLLMLPRTAPGTVRGAPPRQPLQTRGPRISRCMTGVTSV